ncbi:hypothetical protein NO559_10645 [Dasania sp. GY-MA-18]|uniref:Uncharacterized protein n=2 Tax=Dasania phycosphaerae TaxID=2950436 RepID=A0A9J6RMT6_9GAMM|nr:MULTISPECIES: hypothetical protein [Dasania]MCR8923234.1 hypothetical protein [Dasania sp. GY-MA-18]MCZ0865666.1 hypothetical protein [Dasania phycosphaerae]MCZ0869391.1 hypothetical protein [Dasania phycosphaerae]
MLINRRTLGDRRQGGDRRKAPRLDLSHKRRRKNDQRRDCSRSLVEDFHAAGLSQTTRSNLPH